MQGSSCRIHTCQYPLANYCTAGLYVGQPWRFDRDLKKTEQSYQLLYTFSKSFAQVLKNLCLIHLTNIIRTTNLYKFYAETTNNDYLLHYLSVVQTVSNNSNVGMGNDSQYIYFTICIRIYRLVIHCFTAERKNRQLHNFNNAYFHPMIRRQQLNYYNKMHA